MAYAEDALAISDFLTAKFSGTNWDIVRRAVNKYMLAELSLGLPNSDFDATLKAKLREQFTVAQLVSFRQKITTFLDTYNN